jgi:molybdopterin-containing oxidoreductase family iron-sulfur binding subunit
MPDRANIPDRWWRSREEFSGAPIPAREFEEGEADAALAGLDRRDFLKLMGASLALAGAASATGCSKPQPPEKIVPYVTQPEGLVPGVPRFYASALPLHGYARGIIVEQHEGRPTKIEGNPLHPSSLGGTDLFTQAAILDLYDPDRATAVMNVTQTQTWSTFVTALNTFLQNKGDPKQLRLRLLTGTITSPTIVAQIQLLHDLFPQLVWHQHESVGLCNTHAGTQRAFGRPLMPVYDFTAARRIISLDAHFLADDPGSVRYAREFAQRRRLPFKAMGPVNALAPEIKRAPLTADTMGRLYMAESTVTFTGARADHRLAVKSQDIPAVAALLADPSRATHLSPEAKAWAAAAMVDLRSAGSAALILAGENQPPEVHALAHALNASLGSVGTTVHYIDPVEATDNPSLAELTAALHADEVDLLLILDSNPVYTSPADIPFAEALQNFSTRHDRLAVSLCSHPDETAELCRWTVPLSHPLEAWGDCRAHDGTASIIQPLIEPLYTSKSIIEFLGALLALGRGDSPPIDGYDLVRAHWFSTWKSATPADSEMRWRKSLHDGMIPDTTAATIQVAPVKDLRAALADLEPLLKPSTGIELNFRPDPSVHAGEQANNPWLQELPKPLTRLTWDNAALVSPATAARLGLSETADSSHESRVHQPVIRLSTPAGSLEAPVWIQPGQPDDAITLYLGGGRRRGGHVLAKAGVDIAPLRSTQNLWNVAAVHIEKLPRTYQLACTQNHQVMDGRDIVRERPIAKLPAPDVPPTSPDLYSSQKDKDGSTVHLSLYGEYRYAGYKWGMVIDLSACIGCNACVIACQAENNIPVVGKEQVLRGREMHWIRIDAYYGTADTTSLADANAVGGGGGGPKMLFQPMACQHCEDAPCEVVCPVEATSHSDEGLNDMTYNRCVGTRYCSNNCPYKVRRFNFLQYNDHDQLTWNMQKNPNVTVRSRGVMEKCTYCVQRINRARIDGKRDWSLNDAVGKPTELRTIENDGWVTPEKLPRLKVITACQQACPAEAIVFGDMNDTQSAVHLLKTRSTWAAIDYGVLTELNTQPRTSYLERLANPNPALSHLRGGEA